MSKICVSCVDKDVYIKELEVHLASASIFLKFIERELLKGAPDEKLLRDINTACKDIMNLIQSKGENIE